MSSTGDIVIDSLKDWGVDVIFGIPGDGNNEIIEAIRKRKDVKFVLTRHEQSAAFMACAIPYSIAGQIAFPNRQSIVLVGDGGFAMSSSEFATAVKYDLPIKIFVFKNNSFLHKWNDTFNNLLKINVKFNNKFWYLWS